MAGKARTAAGRASTIGGVSVRLIDADALRDYLDKRRTYEIMDGRNKAYGNAYGCVGRRTHEKSYH